MDARTDALQDGCLHFCRAIFFKKFVSSKTVDKTRRYSPSDRIELPTSRKVASSSGWPTQSLAISARSVAFSPSEEIVLADCKTDNSVSTAGFLSMTADKTRRLSPSESKASTALKKAARRPALTC